MLRSLLIFLFMMEMLSCTNDVTEDRPNILWIYLEDTSPLLGCYGEELISTPHIDNLASRGTLFTQAIMPAPVCSASRSSIITGMMSTTLGLHNHHSSRTEESSIMLPDSVLTLPELFRRVGYFTFNNGKDDYNFWYDRDNLYDQEHQSHPLYGKRGTPIELATLSAHQPFFGQIQLAGGKEIFKQSFEKQVDAPVDRSKIKLPPYIPNHPVLVEEYADHLDAIQLTDIKVGDIIGQLKEQELLENTIVFFFSDHGMRLTRHKQFLYQGGLHVPLVIADFRQNPVIKSGHKSLQLFSGLDLAPTTLSLAGIPIPSYMEGIDQCDQTNRREYVISTRDRCDFTIDRIRSVRTENHHYIRNYLPERPRSQLTYMDVDSVSFVLTMKSLYNSGKLDPTQAQFFDSPRAPEELYDLRNDPHELINLAADPSHSKTLLQHRTILEDWIDRTNDQGQYPEGEANLKLMLGIWGDHAINPEYEPLRKKYPDLAGSQFHLKSSHWK